VARIEETGARIFSTDQDGAIALETDGDRVWMRTWTGRELVIEADGELTR
jgi:beta-lactamase superfamily II metal-dependent hydrolase